MEKTVEQYQKAAEQGDAEAQYHLGYCYEYGKGIAKDETQAVYWYKKAAEQGDADAQLDLGMCYNNGTGIAKDEVQAVYWYKKAAGQGNVNAQALLGSCYEYGIGIAKDEAQAVYWYKKAAGQGDADAQYDLAVCYYSGKGVVKDEAQAVFWYKKAADQGHADAQYNLSLCHNNVVEEEEEELEKEERKVWIKCNSCGESYFVGNKEDWQKNGLTYECSKCGGKISVHFFGLCNECEEYVGFVYPDFADGVINFAKLAVESFSNPLNAFKSLVDNIPSGNYGICPFCRNAYIQCPNCGVPIKNKADAEALSEIYTCPNCHIRTR